MDAPLTKRVYKMLHLQDTHNYVVALLCTAQKHALHYAVPGNMRQCPGSHMVLMCRYAVPCIMWRYPDSDVVLMCRQVL